MACRSAAVLALLGCLAFAAMAPARAQAPAYEVPSSFINNFSQLSGATAGGLTLVPVTGANMLGLSLASMSSVQITLAPCTIFQPHVHPHPEFAFTIQGKPTFSVVYNNGTLTNVTANTVTNAGAGSFAIFPAGQPHVIQNAGCSTAVVQAVFPVAEPAAYFLPFSEAYLPANTIASFYNGKVSASDLSEPVLSAPLAGCSCGGRKMA